MTDPNQSPEEVARDKIDQMLINAGWVVQSKKKVNLAANIGVAIREYQTDLGPADYVLFINKARWYYRREKGRGRTPANGS